ncbi:WXG100 family type VII secretion target [Nocardia beijingensis]|uniref:WXG100 family type VII secretion target n=1 Tax=Nocardia beijingensis TaxID=95162 RepID=UPI0033E91510
MTTGDTADGYDVDLEHLDNVTARIGGLVGFITDSLVGLDTRIAAAHLTWSGEAAAAHATAHKEWAQAATEVREGIDAMRAAAATAHGAYTAALTTNLGILGR